MKSKMLSVIVAAGLLLLAIPPAQAQQQQKQQASPNVQGPPGGCPPNCGGGGGGYGSIPPPPSTLSTGVFQTATQKMVVIQNEAVAGSGLKAADMGSAATAMQNVFANMDETGYTAKVQAWILANPTIFTTLTPTTAELTQAYNTIVTSGIKETYSQFVQGITGVPLDVRQMLITNVQQYGLSYVHSQIIAAMNATANSAQVFQNHNGGRLLHVVRDSPSWYAVGAEYLGIVLLSMSVIAAAPAVVIGIGVAGVALGAVDLFTS